MKRTPSGLGLLSQSNQRHFITGAVFALLTYLCNQGDICHLLDDHHALSAVKHNGYYLLRIRLNSHLSACSKNGRPRMELTKVPPTPNQRAASAWMPNNVVASISIGCAESGWRLSGPPLFGMKCRNSQTVPR